MCCLQLIGLILYVLYPLYCCAHPAFWGWVQPAEESLDLASLINNSLGGSNEGHPGLSSVVWCEKGKQWPSQGSVSRMMTICSGQQAFHPKCSQPTVQELHFHPPVVSRGGLGTSPVHMQPQHGGSKASWVGRECVASRAVLEGRWGYEQRQKSSSSPKVASGSATCMSDTAAVLLRFGALWWDVPTNLKKRDMGEKPLAAPRPWEKCEEMKRREAKISILFKRICSAFSFACQL